MGRAEAQVARLFCDLVAERDVIRSGFLRNPCCAQGAQPNHSLRFTLQASLQLNRMNDCDPVGIRTRDPQLRRLLLYPAELPDPA